MRGQRGFSMLELLMVVVVFTVITGAVFLLLNTAQQRYRIESELLDSFQGARLALDQIARDVHTAGYPPVRNLPALAICLNPQDVALPFASFPNYSHVGYPGPAGCPAAAPACVVGVSCRIPSPFDLIIETDLDPEAVPPNGVEWVRYRLNGTTLERGVASKAFGADPMFTTTPFMIPYLENVMNNTNPAEMAQIQASYPNMFPGGAPVPVFTYSFDTGGNTPDRIREVSITLIVRAQSRDPRTQQLRVATLTGLARRFNPN